MSDENEILTPVDEQPAPSTPAPVSWSRTTIGAISGLALAIAVVGVVALRGGSSPATTDTYVPPANALFTGIGGELVAPGQDLETFVRLPAGMAPVGDIEITGDAVGHFVVLETQSDVDDDHRFRVKVHVSNTDEVEHRFEAKVWFRMQSGAAEPAEPADAGDGEMDGGL